MYSAFFISWKITGEKFKGGMTMAPTATLINDLLSAREEEDYNAAIRYIQFLAVTRKQTNAAKSKAALAEIQDMFADDKDWDSEEDMLADMAEFRRSRLK